MPLHSTRSPAIATWLRLARLYGKIDRASRAGVRRRGLSLAHFDVLAQLTRRPGMTQQALADALFVTKGNVSQVLDRMESARLIERRPLGRTSHVFPTELGCRLAAQAVPAQERLIERRFGSLSALELRALARLLRKLDRSTEDCPT
jgi:DNA-binding MarR family transcriptional regulator